MDKEVRREDECKYCELLNHLKEENKKLKERNKNQYEQLDELHILIENKDWESLSNINKFQKRIDEQLQKEEKMLL